MVKNRQFVGTVTIRNKGKIFGTSRQVNAPNKTIARAQLKKKFAFPGNLVTVRNLKDIRDIKT